MSVLTQEQHEQVIQSRIKLADVRKEIKEAKSGKVKRDFGEIMYDLIDAVQEIADVVSNL